MGRWTAKWAAFLARLRASRGYHPDVLAWFQVTDGLLRGLHSIVDLRWILQVSAPALVPQVRGSPAPRPRAPSAVHHALGGVEVGDSGGDILQGAAAMAVRARGTHPPA